MKVRESLRDALAVTWQKTCPREARTTDRSSLIMTGGRDVLKQGELDDLKLLEVLKTFSGNLSCQLPSISA